MGETRRDKGGERQRLRGTQWNETEISGRETRMERQRWGEMRLIEILGRETGEVRERGEQEIHI